MIETLDLIDRQIFLSLNGLHSDWLDPIMFSLTNALNWIPLFILVIALIIRNYHWQAVAILVGIILVIIGGDQISASLIKPLVGRLRPSHNPDLEGLVHIVNSYRGGQFSFVSSHAANSMGIASFLWLSCHKKLNWIWLMFAWAVLFSYTRIYLGVHYTGDILCGWLLGILIGWTVYQIMKLLPIPDKYSFYRTS